MKEKVIYEAFDGKYFETEETCRNYELSRDFISWLNNSVYMHDSDYIDALTAELVYKAVKENPEKFLKIINS